MIGGMDTRSGEVGVDQGATESGLQDSELVFHEYAIAGIESLYLMVSRLAPDNGQATELLREAIEAAAAQWSTRPPHQSPEVWLMKALRTTHSDDSSTKGQATPAGTHNRPGRADHRGVYP